MTNTWQLLRRFFFIWHTFDIVHFWHCRSLEICIRDTCFWFDIYVLLAISQAVKLIIIIISFEDIFQKYVNVDTFTRSNTSWNAIQNACVDVIRHTRELIPRFRHHSHSHWPNVFESIPCPSASVSLANFLMDDTIRNPKRCRALLGPYREMLAKRQRRVNKS